MSYTFLPKLVLNWFDYHGRKSLPWQQDKSPYRVYVSEIMLQQTQVATVIPYYERFMAQFPDVFSLANAEEDSVLYLWTGLGYYNRARNLHKTAKIIAKDYLGIFPCDLDILQSLPGIGRSTAGAIMAIAFEKKAAILDGNVKRVLTRLYGITEWPGEKATHAYLWTLAEELTPDQRVADYTQAMMDIGATLCKRGQPNCLECPLQENCLAFKQGLTQSIPGSKPKKTSPLRITTFLLLKQGNQILLQKRPKAGIWAGLWSLPEITGKASSQQVREFCQKNLRCTIQKTTDIPSFIHVFSHFRLEVNPVLIEIQKTKLKLLEANQEIWYNLEQPARVGLPAPIKALLERINDESSSTLCEA